MVLPGKSGTLAELAFLWALHRAGSLGPRPIVLLGDGWGRLVGALCELEVLEPIQMRVTREARSVEEAVELVDRCLAKEPADRYPSATALRDELLPLESSGALVRGA